MTGSNEHSGSKLEEYRRVFTELPNVLIQDPAREQWYYIPAGKLRNFEAGAQTWPMINSGTVTFVIPDGALLEEVPPFVAPGETDPSVLIQYRRGNTAYFLTHEQLQGFATAWESDDVSPENLISFIVPVGNELIEELPELRRALLQSGTTVAAS